MNSQTEILAVGYDYGTTTSLLESFDLISHFQEVDRRPSSYKLPQNEIVASPKRLLCDNMVAADKDGIPYADIRQHIPVTEVIANFSREMLQSLKLNDGQQIHLTLTVPDSYTNFECSLMRSAICEAIKQKFQKSFDLCADLSLLPEPVAATFYFTYQNLTALAAKGTSVDILTCDVGGGTSDLALVRVKVSPLLAMPGAMQDVYDLSFNVLATAGNPQLGGNDITKLLVAEMADKLELDTYSINSSWMWNSCERLKICLSDKDPDEIVSEYAKDDYGNVIDIGGQPVCFVYTRAQLETLVRAKFWESEGLGNKLRDCIHNVKKSAIAKIKEINKHLLDSVKEPGINFNQLILLPVGGSMRMPLFRDVFCSELNASQLVDLEDGIFDCVARGAALYSAFELGKLSAIHNLKIENRTPFSLSVGHSENRVEECIPRNSIAGMYYVSLYPLKGDENNHTFELSDFTFYQSAHKTFTTDGAKILDILSLGHTRCFEVEDGSPFETPIVLEFNVCENVRKVGVRIRIENVRENPTDAFGTFYYPIDFHYLKF